MTAVDTNLSEELLSNSEIYHIVCRYDQDKSFCGMSGGGALAVEEFSTNVCVVCKDIDDEADRTGICPIRNDPCICVWPHAKPDL